MLPILLIAGGLLVLMMAVKSNRRKSQNLSRKRVFADSQAVMVASADDLVAARAAQSSVPVHWHVVIPC
jgi:hypothetical protein